MLDLYGYAAATVGTIVTVLWIVIKRRRPEYARYIDRTHTLFPWRGSSPLTAAPLVGAPTTPRERR